MPNFLTEFFNKDLNSLKKIQSFEDLKSYFADESFQKSKKKIKNRKLKLLNYDETSSNENINSELFLLFNKIYSLDLSQRVKEEFILKVLNIYDEKLNKEEVLLFLSSFWHINGSEWSDFKFLFVIWLKVLKVESIDISEKTIELIWFQDALLNVTNENKLIDFINDLQSFMNLVNFQNYPISESLNQLMQQPDNLKEQEIYLTEQICNLIVSLFCKDINVQLEKIYLDLLSVLVDNSNIKSIDYFTRLIRANLKNWIMKEKHSIPRSLYFLQQIWQKRLISFSHFLEFTFLVGKCIPKRKNNLYIDFVLNMYYSSFLQINHLMTLINDNKILFYINKKNKDKIFEIFEGNAELFGDIEALKFYIGLNKTIFFFRNGLSNFFNSIITNPLAWHSFVTFILNEKTKNQEKFLYLFVKYFSNPMYNVNFNTINEKYFDFVSKLSDIITFCNEDVKIFIFEKMIRILNNDERYASVIPSLVLLFLDSLSVEVLKETVIERFKESIIKLNPLTMNANYYRMFLRDSFRIVFRKDIEATHVEDLYHILDSFLESYILYSNLLIPEHEKVEFLEYLLTNDLTKETSEKIFNWIKAQPNLSVKIITNVKQRIETRKNIEQNHQTEFILKNIKCGSCLREISSELDKKLCEVCDIVLCITCFIEFEFSGENCPGSIFGNKTHKFKIRR